MAIVPALLRTAPYFTVRGYELLLQLRRDPLLAIIDQFVKSGDAAVDVGAHLGWYTRRLADRTGPEGRVHAIEPNPDSLRVLNTLGSRHPNVRIHAIAASDRAGAGVLRRPYLGRDRRDARGSLSNPAVETGEHDSVEVRLAPVDELLAVETRHVSLIKCDVEGYEHEVLVGARRIIEAHHPVLIVEIVQQHRLRSINDTFDWILSRSYSGYFIVGRGMRPLEEFDLERDQPPYVESASLRGKPHPTYVSDFLFVPVEPGESI